jgi:response regulator RpfG family c-di-GMP phosphodiesterase/serine/threonine protein kinase
MKAAMSESISIPLPPAGLRTTLPDQVVSGSPSLLRKLMAASMVLAEDWEALPEPVRNDLARCRQPDQLLANLVEQGLLTDYQAARIDAGSTFGLVLGNYRVLDRLGAGGMGVVFRAEHVRMRRQVAIKVLPVRGEQDPRLLRRFLTEIRAIAQLQHPNIVAAFDAGELSDPDGDGPVLHFFVMEYVPGRDLEEHVRSEGPLPPAKACDLIHQVASALAEAHKHNLVHRDIKPSNVQVTPEGQAKLLDFGLARCFRSGMTEPGTLLGTLDYMAPEQVQDASSVDIRADLYALGGTLYYCLTGKPPFPSTGSIVQELAARIMQEPPSVRAARPEVPAELDAIVGKMMARLSEDRYPTPQAVMQVLLPFLRAELRDYSLTPDEPAPADLSALAPASNDRVCRVLLVDDESDIRAFCRFVLQADGLLCDEAMDGPQALERVRTKPYDLVVLDINMPGPDGTEICRRLREAPPWPNLKVLMTSGGANADVMAQMLLAGADDFVTKPFSLAQLQARVKAALRLKKAQDRSDLLNRNLLAVNRQLEESLGSRDADLVHARNALVLALAKLVEQRACESGAHLMRLQRYCRTLAEEASRSTSFAGQIDAAFIETLECCAPLHDIGKVGLPDHILLKPGKLEPEERLSMQTHTVVGAEALQQVLDQHGPSLGFLRMAVDITRHHHERWDGKGYPDRLSSTAIPLAARLVALADVYDALRSRRPYKPAYSHAAAMQMMHEASGSQFDPALMQVFLRCAPEFERLYRECPD